ncbi:putative peptidyl-prolyl cis-trans isomerase [Gordonia hirsuta DSM 44140 = NBRC 16056]|uniref:Putative peptidyl-prolyl cis-trans isomerase n=1 Tax=Gordonia hirsuta DSM 44140 = NBRC 16056 TaxID=1121927 RepID=L7LBD5_9ACTN|nr:peptidylprolyl isomerase [Gordonia hirsuta]GAC57353.1 putative peptidyl-prolyl cis-trans isomerase [Gordonia hirsuta DSM 44140 = NBRC 16056]
MTSNEQRREAAKRKLEQRLEAEHAQARKRRMMIWSAAGAVAIAVLATGAYFGYRAWDDSRRVTCVYNEAADPFKELPDELPDTVPAEQRGQVQELLDHYRKGSDKLRTAPRPDTRPFKDGTVSVSFDTSIGAIDATLNRADAPCNVNGVLTLAESGYYNDVPCSSIAISKDGGAILCGDPTTTAGTQAGWAGGNPGWGMPDEMPTELKPHGEPNPLDPSEQLVTYPKGTIAVFNANQPENPMMGQPGADNTGAGTLYFFLKDTPLLPNYAVIGHVDQSGMAILDKIADNGIVRGPGANTPKPGEQPEAGLPKTPVIIKDVAVSD